MAIAAPPAFAQSENSQQIALEQQPLAASLVELGEVFGVSIIVADRLTRGKMAPSVSGNLTMEEALEQILRDSGLAARQLANGSFVVREQSAESSQAETIIVTGTKIETGVQDSTESVEVYTEERLEDEVLFNLSDAITRSPNTSILGDNLNLINIRGINRNGTNGAGSGTAINIFVDGVPLSPQSLSNGATTVWDLEQVEILRGSQSTVQGRNSIAGAVVVQSKKPTYDWEGAARLRFAEFGTRQFAGAISGPIIDDQIAFRASADYQESDGIVTDGFSGESFDSRENLILRGRLLFEPEFVDDLSALFTVEFNDRLNGNGQAVLSQAGAIGFDPQDRVTFAQRNAINDVETLKLVADVSYEFSDSVTLKLLGTLEDMDFDFVADDRLTTQFGQPGAIQFINREIYTGEARLDFDFDNLTGFVGGYYYTEDLTNEFIGTQVIAQAVPFPINPVDSLIQSNFTTGRDTENFAFFTSWRYEPNEKWTIDFGARYDDEGFTSTQSDTTFEILPANCMATVPGSLVGVPLPVLTIPCAQGATLLLPPTQPLQTDDFGVFLPRGAVTYSVNDDVSLFAGARRGYRAGGTALARSFVAGEIFRVVTFDPEFLTTFEAGWRSQWLDDRLTINGTAFYSEYEDQQVSFTDENGFQTIVNAGATSLYGLEVSLDFRATSEWRIYGSLGLLDTRVDDFVFAQDDPATPENEFLDLTGNELERSPNVSFSIGSNYNHDSGFFVSASLSYKSSYYSDIFNLGSNDLGNGFTERVGAAALVNARIGYEIDEFLTITGFVTNLFDENSPENINVGAADAARGLDDVTDNILSFNLRQPQTFGIIMDAKF